MFLHLFQTPLVVRLPAAAFCGDACRNATLVVLAFAGESRGQRTTGGDPEPSATLHASRDRKLRNSLPTQAVQRAACQDQPKSERQVIYSPCGRRGKSFTKKQVHQFRVCMCLCTYVRTYRSKARPWSPEIPISHVQFFLLRLITPLYIYICIYMYQVYIYMRLCASLLVFARPR